MGRKKIEVQKIEDKNKRMATFRKRCSGLFKKADEIHRLTGAEVQLRVTYSGRQYYLKRSGSTIPTPKLKLMEYTIQRVFKNCTNPPNKEIEVCSNAEADTTTSNSTPVQSDDSESAPYPVNENGDLLAGESCKDLLKEICSCLQYIVRDEVYRRSRENSALLKTHNDQQPTSGAKIIVQNRECQTTLGMETSGLDRGVQSSHLQPVEFINDDLYVPQTSMTAMYSSPESLGCNPHFQQNSAPQVNEEWMETSYKTIDNPESPKEVTVYDPKVLDQRTKVVQEYSARVVGNVDALCDTRELNDLSISGSNCDNPLVMETLVKNSKLVYFFTTAMNAILQKLTDAANDSK